MVIGVGLDIQEIARMERALKRGGAAFLRKTFAPAEIAYCRKQKRSSQHFCGRFCAKEAFFKALGTGWARGVKWQEVEVLRNHAGRPHLRLSGRTAELSRRAGVKTTWLSLSHSHGYAAATVVLEG
jgi:holo-[acyl-carrier protein] synthase